LLNVTVHPHTPANEERRSQTGISRTTRRSLVPGRSGQRPKPRARKHRAFGRCGCRRETARANARRLFGRMREGYRPSSRRPCSRSAASSPATGAAGRSMPLTRPTASAATRASAGAGAASGDPAPSSAPHTPRTRPSALPALGPAEDSGIGEAASSGLRSSAPLGCSAASSASSAAGTPSPCCGNSIACRAAEVSRAGLPVARDQTGRNRSNRAVPVKRGHAARGGVRRAAGRASRRRRGREGCRSRW
jgi:hypothetical protein